MEITNMMLFLKYLYSFITEHNKFNILLFAPIILLDKYLKYRKCSIIVVVPIIVYNFIS